MKSLFRLTLMGSAALLFYFGFERSSFAQTTSTNVPDWMTQPLSVLGAMNLALQQNATILKAQNDLSASFGIVVQTRAIALPQLSASGTYKNTEPSAIETIPVPGFTQANQNWNGGFQLTQTIFDGGKLIAAIKAARLTKDQAMANYNTVVADTLLNTRTAYYDALLAQEQITVHEASVKLLQNELDDQRRRYKAGTVPQFNVLRAEVQLANERPLLIQARNNFRIAKNNLSNSLGYNLPTNIWEDIPLQFRDKLDATPYTVDLPSAIEEALQNRSELVALRKTEDLQELNIVNARAGYMPNVYVFAGYNWFNAQYAERFVTPPLSLEQNFHGYNFGAQVNWDIFDGLLTRGKVMQAKADYAKSKNDFVDETRQIELQVRTAYSDFVEAKEVLDSQKTVLAEAEEALREAKARFDAGTGTQLDVLDAETSLTQARATNVQALHDYDTARAKVERAVGENMIESVRANP